MPADHEVLHLRVALRGGATFKLVGCPVCVLLGAAAVDPASGRAAEDKGAEDEAEDDEDDEDDCAPPPIGRGFTDEETFERRTRKPAKRRGAHGERAVSVGGSSGRGVRRVSARDLRRADRYADGTAARDERRARAAERGETAAARMRESVAAPVAASAPGVGDSGRARGARAAAAAAPRVPDAAAEAAAIELGVDVGTYRLLEQLQFGNITPEDYELLLALHAPANTQTLDIAAIERIPRVVAAAPDARPPPPPLPTRGASETVRAGGMCMICMCEIEAGEELRRLPCACRHVFHRACIDEWLSKSSVACPIDQEDLRGR